MSVQAQSPKKATPAPDPAALPVTKLSPDNVDVIDEELEKRKKRAARFGVPLVETPNARLSPTKRGASVPRNAATPRAPLDVCSYHG
jgi:SAP domain-containing ribonucleoprotein